ncbi:MAG: hypothetical protein WDN29_00700 [Methylovirgula sp.]
MRKLTSKLDHTHAATAEKARVARLDAQAIQATLDRAARTETASGDSTGSIPNAAAPGPVTLASAEAPAMHRNRSNDWVVRDVYRGIALVEGPQGAVEVMPGDTLPGAGTVRATRAARRWLGRGDKPRLRRLRARLEGSGRPPPFHDGAAGKGEPVLLSNFNLYDCFRNRRLRNG